MIDDARHRDSGPNDHRILVDVDSLQSRIIAADDAIKTLISVIDVAHDERAAAEISAAMIQGRIRCRDAVEGLYRDHVSLPSPM